MNVRLANHDEAAAVHKILSSAKHEIPLVDNFDDEKYVDWVRRQCVDQVVWIMEGITEPAGVMMMKDNENTSLYQKIVDARAWQKC